MMSRVMPISNETEENVLKFELFFARKPKKRKVPRTLTSQTFPDESSDLPLQFGLKS